MITHHAHLEITEDNLVLMEAYAKKNHNPIVMVNLMNVREVAQYEDKAVPSCSGYEAFARYTKGSSEVRAQSGAKLLWTGKAHQMPIGPSEKTWHMVALMWYPNAQAYLTMKATKAYQAARVHRRAALYDSRLIMATPTG